MARRAEANPGGISHRDLTKPAWFAAAAGMNEGRDVMQFKHLVLGAACAGMVSASALVATAQAQDTIYIPLLTYRTGAFANSGIPIANGMHDYLDMLNERDGGIGGVKLAIEECETSYDTKKGLECWDTVKAKKPVVVNPYSTGITLAIIPKAAPEKIPVLAMAYGLSASADGNNFPWIFNPPATYWDGLSMIIKYIGDKEGGLDKLKGKTIGFIFFDGGYGREPLPLLHQLAKDYGFETKEYPVPPADMQNQSGLWLSVRRDRPDYMIMWGWGAMNPTAVKEAAKINYPMDKFVSIWWGGGEDDARPTGADAKGFTALNFAAVGATFPAIQDVLKDVVDKGKSQVDRPEPRRLAASEQQHGVARVLLKPLFRSFQLLPYVRAEAFGINGQKCRVPLAFESFLHNLVRLLTAAQRDERLRCGCGDAGIISIIRGKPVPIFPQRFVIYRFALEAFDDGLPAQLGHDRTLEHPALLELGNECQHSFPVHCHLLRTQFQAKGRSMFFRKPLQHVQSIVITTLIEQHFRLRHEPHRVFVGIRAGGFREIFVAGGIGTHAVCGARRKHGGKRGGFAGFQRRGRGLFRASKTALEEIDQRFIEYRTRPVLGTPLLKRTHARRHGRRNDDGARDDIGDEEDHQHQQDREVQRQFGAPRRQDQQYIAVVVARRNHQPDCDRKQGQHPQQCPHQCPLLRPGRIESTRRAFAHELEIARRIQARGNVGHLHADFRLDQLFESGLRACDRLVCAVVVLRQPAGSRFQVGLETAFIVREQRQASPEQAELQILPQEECLVRRKQRDFGFLDALDADQIAHVLFAFAPQPLPETGRGRFLVRIWPGGSLFHGQRQCVDLVHDVVQAQSHAHDIHVRRRLQSFHVLVDHPAQGGQLRPVHARQARIGRFQGDQRRLHVAGQLQLPVGDLQNLFDLGQCPLVATARDPDNLPERRLPRAQTSTGGRGGRGQSEGDTAARGQQAKFSLPSPSSSLAARSGPGLRLSWIVYRGKASAVTFAPDQMKTWMDTRPFANSPWSPPYLIPEPPPDNTWTVTATFATPGTYDLRAVASDGSLFTYDNVTIDVRQ